MWACNINSSYQDICIAGWSKPLLTSWDPCHIMVSLLVSGITYTTGQHLVAIVKVSMVYPLNNTNGIFAFLFLLELLQECSSPRMKALLFFSSYLVAKSASWSQAFLSPVFGLQEVSKYFVNAWTHALLKILARFIR